MPEKVWEMEGKVRPNGTRNDHKGGQMRPTSASEPFLWKRDILDFERPYSELAWFFLTEPYLFECLSFRRATMRPSRRMTQQRLKLIPTNAQKVPQMSLRIERQNVFLLCFWGSETVWVQRCPRVVPRTLRVWKRHVFYDGLFWQLQLYCRSVTKVLDEVQTWSRCWEQFLMIIIHGRGAFYLVLA